jgi:hypothetical protein
MPLAQRCSAIDCCATQETSVETDNCHDFPVLRWRSGVPAWQQYLHFWECGNVQWILEETSCRINFWCCDIMKEGRTRCRLYLCLHFSIMRYASECCLKWMTKYLNTFQKIEMWFTSSKWENGFSCQVYQVSNHTPVCQDPVTNPGLRSEKQSLNQLSHE